MLGREGLTYAGGGADICWGEGLTYAGGGADICWGRG